MVYYVPAVSTRSFIGIQFDARLKPALNLDRGRLEASP